ncbi:MAG: SsrA-binding protein SmpB [Betaproteobacteria bacterium]|jgi:SsrA-binding protein
MTIVENRKARFNYFIEDQIEAGIVLQGWEVKAIRAGRANIQESYVVSRGNEFFLTSCHISPLASTSTHFLPEPIRNRKLLLHSSQIIKLIAKVNQAGFTLVPLNFHYSKGHIKCEIGLAKGKKTFDKREVEKDRDWSRDQARIRRGDLKAL